MLKFILFLICFFLIVEILCILFKFTGLSEEKARFQVISLLTGTGFTTKEAEMITQHNTRRKLAQFVMAIGYLGLATFMSFIINIIQTQTSTEDIVYTIVLLIVGIIVFRNKYIVYIIDALIEKIISHKFKTYSNTNFYRLLNNTKGYGLYNILLEKNSSLIGKSLINTNLKQNNIQILNVDKGNKFIAFPNANYILEKNDNILVYGKIKNILKIFKIKKEGK